MMCSLCTLVLRAQKVKQIDWSAFETQQLTQAITTRPPQSAPGPATSRD
ncbi:MAG: hypothetical protein HC890_19345 [Chloroflexaceae bacterium]|nr:hypothetical protein [Chloroflexaceae bacterium]